MSSETVFKGYAIHDSSKWTDFKLTEFKAKTFIDEDVEITIDYCGVCGSDVHTITGGWGHPILPVIVGHEIVGKVVKVGPKVTEFKPGDRVGVGAQVWSCGDCAICAEDNENYCPHQVDTYNAKYPSNCQCAGEIAYGGYSTAIRVSHRFVFHIPEGLASEQAAPMLCGGLTVFSPLLRNGAGPGKKVGIVGVGGLGHYAIQFAKALGAEVTVLSHSSRKREDATKLGADHFVVTGEANFADPIKLSLDLLVVTANIIEGDDLNKLLSTLRIHGRLIMVALPEDSLPKLTSNTLVSNGCLLGGSHIGSKKEAIQMLQLAVEKGVKSWIEVLPMSKAAEAVTGVHEGKARYRYVLKNDIE
ncbi:GroES-like protein [Flagelloscypha sp. PMI_526]|nr:GroES-like protein [Flagelloscypha sp. PMI_526]